MASKRKTLPALDSPELSLENLAAEFREAGIECRKAAEAASEEGNAYHADSLSRAAGIIRDHCVELDSISKESTAPGHHNQVQVTCECHASGERHERMHELLAKWAPPALLNITRLRDCLKETPLHPRNCYNWAKAAGVDAQKVVDYYKREVVTASSIRAISAHRHEIPALVERLEAARRTLLAQPVRQPA